VTHDDWMRSLAAHVGRMHSAHPGDELAIVFDIDGTIVDTRHLVVHVLLSYDRHHGTDLFRGITAADVVDHEALVDEILDPFALHEPVRRDVRTWYLEHVRDAEAVAASHRPYQGVLGVIRWFQLRPQTHVALNTGRSESMRELTLASLNALGALHRVAFEPELLFMNATGADDDVAPAKIEGLRRMQDAGYRVVAVVDNEPALIRAMAEADETSEILFLHADTIFASRREPTPRTVSGSTYGLTGLVEEAELGRRVTLAWHGVNDDHNLQQFLASEIGWAEMDVRRDPIGRLVLRHDSFLESPWAREEAALPFRDCLEVLRWTGRSVKLDLKEGGEVVDEVLDTVRRFRFPDEELWFNGAIQTLGREGFACLRRARPGAIMQAPIDFLVPLLLAAPALAEKVLDTLRDWGVTRVSLDWRTPGARDVLDLVEGLGWQVNLYGVPDLEAFLEAALLLPASVTADFNFPEWSYDGRGPSSAVPTVTSVRSVASQELGRPFVASGGPAEALTRPTPREDRNELTHPRALELSE
jgi:phosphoglycolate phosphatase-like HAD superfamily hydrolase